MTKGILELMWLALTIAGAIGWVMNIIAIVDAASGPHCHVTGVFRGWLCNKCNAGFGMLGDNLAGVERRLEYLRRFERGGEISGMAKNSAL